MPRVPAICEKCRTIFGSGFNLGTSATNISFVNCGAGPCPNCGGSGRILDGVYNAVGNAVEAFIGQQDTSHLKELLAVLQLAKKEEWEHEEVVSNIASATPTFKKVADWLPKSTTELYAVIVILIMLINTLINSRKSSFTKDELMHHTEVTINNCYETTTENQPVDTKQVGRNDPCPCGSDKKYKKCCGR